jgi:hypothetical protein
MKGHIVQLRPNIPTWTPPPPYPSMSYPYTYLPPPYVPNQMWGMPPYPFGMPQYPAWGAPQTSVFDRLAPPVQDRLSAAESGHQAQAQQDCRTTRPPRPTNQAGGHMLVTTQRTTKKDIIKIGTADVVIQGDNKGPMIFGESANTTKKDTVTIKTVDPKYSMPRWCPAGLTRSQKRKLQRLRVKESQEKEAEKIFNDTHPLYPPPQKKWRPKAVEEKQTATEIENQTTHAQHLAGMADSTTSKAGQSAPGTDRPASARGPSVLHQEASGQSALGADRPASARGPSSLHQEASEQPAPGADRPAPARGPSGPRARTVRPPRADRPPFTRKPPTTRQHQWRRTTCWEKTWSTTRLL